MDQILYSTAALDQKQHQPQHGISIPRGGAAGVELLNVQRVQKPPFPGRGMHNPVWSTE